MTCIRICVNKLRKHGNLVSLCIARGWGDCNHIVFQAQKSRDASGVADGVSLRCATLLERHQHQIIADCRRSLITQIHLSAWVLAVAV